MESFGFWCSAGLCCGQCRPPGGRDSGRGLDLPVEELRLSLQAPELLLDEVGQRLPHLQLR